MTGYVIVRVNPGDGPVRRGPFVTPAGSKKSYTRDLTGARIFDSREAAEGHRCVDNERIVAVADLLGGLS